MDEKFLSEYEDYEIEQFEKFASINERFPKLATPVFNITCMGPSIWSQIAFSGTMIFPLWPVENRTFEQMYNISTKEIPDLVKFTKETNKIQFVLLDSPKSYSGFDYLDPILEELSPPLYALDKKYQNTAIRKNIDKAKEDLDSILCRVLRNRYDEATKQQFHQDYIRQYAYMDYFGFSNVNEVFIKKLYDDDLPLATAYLDLSYNLLVHPIIDPFKGNPVVSTEMFQKIKKLDITLPEKLSFPEVGSFLFKKLTFYPDSLNACKNVISSYKKNDLYSVYSALNEAVINQNSTAILKNKNELEEIMENVWHDTEMIRTNKKMYKLGVDVACGMVGFTIGGLGGLIGAFGAAAVSTTTSQVLDNFAELIAKKVAIPSIVTIYDFQKKYSIKN